jgi:uncharacterized protein (TIGR02145 family)
MKSLCTIFLLVIFLSSCQEETFTVSTVVTPPGSGSIEISPIKPEYENGETVTITAVPSENWIFKNWEGDDRGSTNPLQIKINSNKSFTSVFSKKPLPVNISIVGEGTVTEKIISSPSGREYPHGSIIELTATPKAGWIFSNFVIDGKSIAERITKIEVLKQSTIFARFILEPVFGTYIDSRGETGPTSKRTYKTVKIGNQTWYAENSRFRGIIPVSKMKSFNNNPLNDQKYGVFYETSISQLWNPTKNFTMPCNNLDGWRMPNKEDWEILINYLGGVDVASYKMIVVEEWVKANPNYKPGITGDNSSGFSVVPGSYSPNTGGSFPFREDDSVFWGDKQGALSGASVKALNTRITPGYVNLNIPEYFNDYYALVRCIKK